MRTDTPETPNEDFAKMMVTICGANAERRKMYLSKKRLIIVSVRVCVCACVYAVWPHQKEPQCLKKRPPQRCSFQAAHYNQSRV